MANPRPAESLYARIDSLDREIARVRAKHHPYRSPELVYDSLSALLKRNRELVDDAVSLFTPGTTGFSEALKTAERMTAVLVDLFTNSDRADSPRIPFEILNSLSAAAEELTKQRCKVMVHLTPQYNYQIVSLRDVFATNGWLEYWKGDEPKDDFTTPQTVLVMVFPSYEVTSILLHAAAAHELGHVFVQQRQNEFVEIVTNATRVVRDNHFDQIEGWVSKQLIRNPGESKRDAFNRGLALFDELFEEIATGWAEEIFADLIAARLVGPPFLLALERITLGIDPAHEDEEELSTHPPDSLRFALVAKYLREKLPHVCDDTVWQDVLHRTFSSQQTNLFLRLAKDVCNRSFDGFAELISEVSTPLADPVTLRKTVLRLQRLLGELSPTSTLINPDTKAELANSFWLLFYAFWHFRLHSKLFPAFRKRYGWSEDRDESKAESAIGSILLHSLQSLELRYLWHHEIANTEADLNATQQG